MGSTVPLSLLLSLAICLQSVYKKTARLAITELFLRLLLPTFLQQRKKRKKGKEQQIPRFFLGLRCENDCRHPHTRQKKVTRMKNGPGLNSGLFPTHTKMNMLLKLQWEKGIFFHRYTQWPRYNGSLGRGLKFVISGNSTYPGSL